MKLTLLDMLIIAAYMSIIAYIGWRSRKFANKGLENYFLGGRKMPGWLAGISYAASMMSADSAVGYGGMAVVTGVFVCWFYLARFGFAFFIGAMLFAVFWKRLNTFTTLEFYEIRFTHKPATLMRLWIAIRSSLIAMVAWTAISVLALVKVAKPVVGLTKNETVLLVLPITIAYLYLSGYLGLVVSNVIQVGVMFVGTIVLAMKVLWALGGPHQLGIELSKQFGSNVLQNLPPVHEHYFPLAAAVAWLIGTSVGYGGDAAPMSGAVEGQRILSTSGPREACKMYLVTEVTVFTMTWLVSMPCLGAILLWPQLRAGTMDRELAYGMLMSRYLGPGLLGLVFVAMLAGLMAVVGDNLNFGSQVLMNDIYRRYFVKYASERHYFWVGRAFIFVILGLALVVVYKVQFLFSVAIFMVGLAAVDLLANWAQWWWWRFNGWGRVAASFGGGLVYIALALFASEMSWWTRMYVSMIGSAALWLAATLITKPEPLELLEKFYVRARPMGWWGPIQERLESQGLPGHKGSKFFPLKRIILGLMIAAIGAVSVMCYIVGISDLYIGRNAVALTLLLVMVIAGFIFWRQFPTYIAGLLTPDEKARARVQVGVADELGLKHALSFAFGVATLVIFSHAVFFAVGMIRWFSVGAAVLTGVISWKVRKKA